MRPRLKTPRRWPSERGRGWLLRLSHRFLRQPLSYRVGAWTRIESALDDSSAVWTFICAHERDASFQRSLDLLRPGAVVAPLHGPGERVEAVEHVVSEDGLPAGRLGHRPRPVRHGMDVADGSVCGGLEL